MLVSMTRSILVCVRLTPQEEKKPRGIIFEAFSKSESDPTDVWPHDWDVAMCIREFHRGAGNV
jgi:hypothetical protein